MPRVLNPLDISTHSTIARNTFSISPTSLALATFDWAIQLSLSPGKRLELVTLGLNQFIRLSCYSRSTLLDKEGRSSTECVVPPSFDKRFQPEQWQRWPFNILHQTFLLTDEWWNAATTNVLGVSRHHEHIVSFMARQWLDMMSPGNFPLTNPVVIQKTTKSHGRNLVRGAINFIDDFDRVMSRKPPATTEQFVVGSDLAATQGKVIMRNRLVELIQYQPQTSMVYPEPVLIMPAWIMKYYILDLFPTSSLVEFLVQKGHTVFCISWKNPGSQDRDLDFDDYLMLGFLESLKAINKIVPNQKIHATGYCLGGTALAIAAAFMAREHDERLASISLFTAQTDFRESGELALFIDESEVSLLEAQMHEKGYLSAGQMAGAFQMLRSNDLMWSRMISEYLIGERAIVSQLAAWNADTTRMPARMHGHYLRELFLNNSLSEGRYKVDGEPITLFNITTPIFCVATLADHVAPWGSVYKLHHLTPTEITFVLTSGGHNAGIVSPPTRIDRYFQKLTRRAGGHYLSHKTWLEKAERHTGSWWPSWADWLKNHSGEKIKPPKLGSTRSGYPPLGDAPGTYVHEK